MNMRNKKLLLVTIASLSMIGVTVTTQTDPVAASPYASGVETETVNNPKEIVINLVDGAGNPVTWIQTNGENGGSSIEYLNQDGDLLGMSPIALPQSLVAKSVIASDKGAVFSVNEGKFYVNLAAISGSVAHFTLNVEQAAVAQPDVDDVPDEPQYVTSSAVVPNEPVYMTSSAVVPNEPVYMTSSAVVPNEPVYMTSSAMVPNEPVYMTSSAMVPNEPVYMTSSAMVPNEPVYMTSSAMVPNEPQYMSSSAVVPNEPIVAPATPHSGVSITNLTPVASAEPVVVPATSEISQASSANKTVTQKSVTSASVASSVIAQVASVANVAPVATANVSSSATHVVTTPITTVAGSVTNQTPGSLVQSTPTSVNATQTQDQVQAVKKPDLISSISDLPKASIWTDKARTFSAISIGMSVVAVAAQFLMTKLGFIKSFL